MSDKVVLKAEVREGLGKEKTKKLRKEGIIPAIYYSKKETPINLQVNELECIAALKKGQQILELQIGKKKKHGLIKDMQFHPVTEKILHIDFQGVSMSEIVTVSVPLKLIGTPSGVREGGLLEVNMYEVEISCKASDIPQELELNIEGVELNTNLHVSDLAFDGIEITSNADNLVLAVNAPSGASDDEEAEGAEAVEGEEEAEGEE